MNWYKQAQQNLGYRSVGQGDYETVYNDIKSDGLIPNWDFKISLKEDGMDVSGEGIDMDKIYTFFATDEEEAARYGDIHLRFPFPPSSVPALRTGYFITDQVIPASVIQIKLDDWEETWIPIKQSVFTRENLIVDKRSKATTQ